ncbi:MAG: DUF2283 domain-containing protein [Methanocalculus sp. MSAO_Arc1]|uniref:DUF2283 domain-containing protein n=1 Tax=Methanocalculus TaxID=71151 RepID=UPI000FF24FC9|nr:MULTISPECIES: DUF2283 domain-containing protein [unclassified Methanocalculus]MCP1663240.1 uncharacterized protein YuzE [Methanocalculus sp. AMF5]RQD80438.1 MAG: DUF2283 domain-containing protein [Methanocalculus sp. MSAO_Arc1]
MKVIIDKEADAPIKDSEEIKPGVILDYDDENNLVGIEILNISRRVPSTVLTSVQLETA